MAVETTKPLESKTQDGWHQLPSETPPVPGVWPAMLALGITFLVWGLITSPIITGIGLVLFIAAMTGWIHDIRHERSKD